MSEEETGAQVTTPPTPDRKEDGFEPCPTCKQYSHSIGDDALAKALMHFEAMTAHPVRGHPMGHVYDEATRDAAQVLIAAAKGRIGKDAVREAAARLLEYADLMPKETPAAGGCSTKHSFEIDAGTIWTLATRADELRAALAATPAQEGEG